MDRLSRQLMPLADIQPRAVTLAQIGIRLLIMAMMSKQLKVRRLNEINSITAKTQFMMEPMICHRLRIMVIIRLGIIKNTITPPLMLVTNKDGHLCQIL